MTSVPSLTGKEILSVLKKAGLKSMGSDSIDFE